MKPIHVLRPRENLAQIGPVGLTPALLELERVPGVRIIDTTDGRDVELPRNVWHLPQALAVFAENNVAVPQPTRPAQTVGSSYLRDYQAEGVAWILNNNGGIVGDQMGLGKTRQAAIAAELARRAASRQAPVIIIGPKFLRQTWYEELVAIGAVQHEDEFCALRGLTLDLEIWKKGAKYFYCHYDIVRAWWPWLWTTRPTTVIIDEAQALKNGRTVRAQTVGQAVMVCPMRIVLTGTPFANRIGELWNLLNLGAGKWSFGTPKAFRMRYAGAFYDGRGLRDSAPSNVEELQTRLASCYIRRTVESVNLKLPPLTRRVIAVPFTREQSLKYKELLGKHDPRVLARALTRGEVKTDVLEVINRLRKITSRAKIEATVDLAHSHLSENLPTIIFTWERATAERILRALAGELKSGFSLVHGGLTQPVRDEAVRQFQQGGRLLVATLGALSVGVNLQHARVTMMHDLDWTPSTLLQAEARMWRQGQQHPVTSEWMVIEDSLDQFLARHLMEKGDVIETVLNDSHGAALADVLGGATESFEDDLAARVARWREMREAWG